MYKECPFFAAIILLVLFHHSPIIAQPNTGSNAELIFANQSYSTEAVSVDVALNGVVFREDGTYATEVRHNLPSNNHPQAGYYQTDDLLGGVIFSLAAGTEKYWESACPTDDPSDPNETVGMIGWGEYLVTVACNPLGVDPQSISFTVNTIDGRWCATSDPEHSVFGFEIYVDDIGDLYVSYYKWGQGWLPVSNGAKITSWGIRNVSQEPRERTELKYTTNKPFKFDASFGPFPLEVDDATLDVNVNVYGVAEIRGGKTFRIRYYMNHVHSPEKTALKFDDDAGLRVYDGNNLYVEGTAYGSYPAVGNLGISFVPITVKSGDYKYKSWLGIMLRDEHNSPMTIDVRGAEIRYAERGIDTEYDKFNARTAPVELIIDSCCISECAINMRFWRCNVAIQHTLIEKASQYGLILASYPGPTNGYEFDLFDCTVRQNNIDGILYSFNLAYAPLNNFIGMTVKDSYIHNNNRNGIYCQNAILSVHDCNIQGNQWDGVYTEDADASIHKNTFQQNGRGGLKVTKSTWAFGEIYDFGGVVHPSRENTLQDKDGRNCFYYNDVNLVALQENLPTGLLPRHPITGANFGVRSSIRPTENDGSGYLPSVIRCGNNWFRDPRSSYQIKAQQYVPVSARYNYWTSYTTSGTHIYKYPPIQVHQAVTCKDTIIAIDSTIAQLYNRPAQDIYENILFEQHDSAYIKTIENLHCEILPEEAMIYAQALVNAYLIEGNQSALDTLVHFAMSPRDPCDTTSCPAQWVFTQYLLKLKLMTWASAFASQDVLAIADTILQRNCDGNAYDEITANLAKVKMYWYAQGNTDAAANLISTLWDHYPEDISVAYLYHHITGDTTAFDYLPKTSSRNQPDEIATPKTITLAQNYPNPFNPNTQISFGIPEDGDVQLTVYDIMGREVAVLATGMHQAGEYTYNFNAGNLPSGVYVYKLRFGNTVLAKQMMLTK